MEPVNVDPLKFDIIFIWIVGGDLYFSNAMYQHPRNTNTNTVVMLYNEIATCECWSLHC